MSANSLIQCKKNQLVSFIKNRSGSYWRLAVHRDTFLHAIPTPNVLCPCLYQNISASILSFLKPVIKKSPI